MKAVSGTNNDVVGQAIATWYMQRTGVEFETLYTAIAWLDDKGVISTAAIFFDFNGWNIEIAYFGRLTKQRVKVIAKHVFNKLGCGRVTIKVKRKDHGFSYPDLGKIGFIREAELARFYGPTEKDDAIIYCALKDDLIPKWVYIDGESS